MAVVWFIYLLPGAALMLGCWQWRQSRVSDGEDPTTLSVQEPKMVQTGRRKQSVICVVFFFNIPPAV